MFLNLPFFLVQFLFFIYCAFKFLVLSVIGVLFVCLLSGCADTSSEGGSFQLCVTSP